MNFQRKRLSDLRVYENNPRDNTSAVAKVKLSIQKYGYKVPIVITEDNVIVAGHTRFAALLQINAETGQYAEIAVVLADDLSDGELREFRIVDNQVAALATWDFTRLQLELSDMPDFDIDDFGIIAGFDTELVLPPDNTTVESEDGVKFSFGSDNFILTEAEYHSWASWVIGQHGCSVVDYVRNQLHIDPNTRTYTNDREI